jgi:hypothetical protein
VSDYEQKLTYVPFDEATTPKDGEVLTNRWWVVHPEHGLAYFSRRPTDRHKSAQCNGDRRLPEKMVGEMYPNHEVRFMPVVFTGQYREEEW